jgi:hypothetical protein
MGWIFSPGGIFTWRNFHIGFSKSEFHIDSDFHMVEFHIDSDFHMGLDSTSIRIFHIDSEFSNAFGFFTLVRIFTWV